MKFPPFLSGVVGLAAVAFFVVPLPAAEPALSASDLASRLSAVREGSSLIRAKLEFHSPDESQRILQLQFKERRTKASADVVCEVLWPKEREGEAVILHQNAGNAPSGSLIAPPAPVSALKAAQMGEGMFGSDLSYQDAIENFFAWETQTIAGAETIDGVECQILESKPGKSGVSIYAKVRSWIDPRRLVALRVEKYSEGGEVVRRIETTRVARDEKDRFIPGNLTVRTPGKSSLTELNGARIDQKVNFTDTDFTPEGLRK